MFNGLMKAVTFSYDDGITQDRRLIDIFNRYGLKATFNINSECLGQAMSLIRNDFTVAHCKPRACEVERIYKGHEVAVHTLTHPNLNDLPEYEIVRQIEEDKKNLSSLVGYEVQGMAYPCCMPDERTIEIVRSKTDMKYARTVETTGNFDIQKDLIGFKPTVYHLDFGKMFALADEFISLKPDEPKLFYIWGHSYEFDYENTWSLMEEFCKRISGRSDIFYGTNAEVLL